MIITIQGELMDLNTYIRNERGNKFAAADIKKAETEKIIWLTKRLGKVSKKVKVVISWYCKNEMKDPDNISFAKKFILDGLVKSGVLQNDGWKQIEGFEDKFIVDKSNPRIEVELREAV